MNKSVLCIGATLVDELYFCESNCIPHTSNPAVKTTRIGGVMGNIAQHLGLLNCSPALITALGSDVHGSYIKANFLQKGIALEESLFTEDNTGTYVSVLNPEGDLVVAVCQDHSSTYLSPDFLATKIDYLKSFDVLVIDTNLATATIAWLIAFANTHQQKLIIEPVSVAKASKLAALDLKGVFMITPNEDELAAIATVTSDSEVELVQHLLNRGVQQVWVRKGHLGSVLYTPHEPLTLGVPKITHSDSTGAGDAALAGWLLGYCTNENKHTCMQLGHALALTVLQHKGAVVPTMNRDTLYQIKKNYYTTYE